MLSDVAGSSRIELIDLERYPLADHEARQRIAAAAAAELKTYRFCALPGFLAAEALGAVLEEVTRLAPAAHYRDILLGAYGDDPDPGLPAGHPRRRRHAFRMGVVAYDRFPAQSALRSLYLRDDSPTSSPRSSASPSSIAAPTPSCPATSPSWRRADSTVGTSTATISWSRSCSRRPNLAGHSSSRRRSAPTWMRITMRSPG